MAEHIQCPVCTLFLHAGMNLSDHLETHPKEQVIQALVQVTLCNTTTNVTSKSKTTAIDYDVRLNEKTNSQTSIKTTSSLDPVSPPTELPLPLPHRPSKSFAQKFEVPSDTTSSASELKSDNLTEEISKNTSVSVNDLEYPSESKSILCNSTTSSGVETKLQNDINIESSKRTESGHLLLQQNTEVSKKDFNFLSNSQPTNTVYDVNNVVSNGVCQAESQSLTAQLKPHPVALYATSMPNLQGIHPLPVQASNQQHNNHHQTKPIQQQNLKLISLGSLGPPPPLQLFGYHQQPQHQKPPPPAYGTAISQIRSQNHQNSINRPPNLHMTGAATSLGILQPARNLASQESTPPTPPPPPPPPPPLLQQQHFQQNQQSQQNYNQSHRQASQFYNKQQNSQQCNRSQHLQFGQTDTLPTGPENSNGDVALIPLQQFTATATATPIRAVTTPVQKAASFSVVDEVLKNSEKVVKTSSSASTPPPSPSFPPPLLQSYQSIQHRPSASFSTFARQTSSPFSVGSPASSSSVLRYAESPVTVTAHYLERENGDFIVQETPKHIVECVERDNGEFSVIERVYHPQPSVVQITDDNYECSSAVEGDSDDFMSVDDDDFSQDGESKKSPSITTENDGLKISKSPLNQSSKNSITVLSNVQLNLNEYLDLVGNIIASNKEVKNRSEFLKVEKFEPPDYDDEMEFETEEKCESKSKSFSEISDDNDATEKLQQADDKRKQQSQKMTQLLQTDNQLFPCSSVVTSVIRMASNPSHKQEIKQSSSGGVRGDVTEKVIEQVKETAETEPEPQLEPLLQPIPSTSPRALEATLSSSKEINSAITPTPTRSKESPIESVDQSKPFPHKAPTLKKAPKKLVIKPKSKTAVVPTTITTSTPPIELPSSSSSSSSIDTIQQNTTTQDKIEMRTLKQEPNPTTSYATASLGTLAPTNKPASPEFEENKSPIATLVVPKQETSADNNNEVNISPTTKDKMTGKIKSDIAETAELNSLLQECMKKENAHEILPDAPTTRILSCSSETSAQQHSAFPSASSVFSKPSPNAATALQSSNNVDEFVVDIVDTSATKNVQEIVSTTFSAHSADAVSYGFVNAATGNGGDTHHSSFSDYPFSFLYGGNGVANQLEGRGHFSPISLKSPIYEGDGVWRWNCVANGSRSSCDADDSHRNASISATGSNTNGASTATNVSHWCQQQSQSANQEFEMGDGDGGGEANGVNGGNGSSAATATGGKYLDLDSYKRAAVTSSFVNESCSLATADALNMRTDEKMPAKGEISEQESNCDVDNSWSQSLHGGEFRFFKTFPTLLNQENNWNTDEYFHPQDLSSTAKAKSFDLHQSEMDESAVNHQEQQQQFIFQQQQSHYDSLPSTSKKKRKRNSETNVSGGDSQEIVVKQSSISSIKSPNHEQENEIFPTGESRLQNSQARRRVFQCVHCKVVFSKLKDRNSHMIVVHNYVRQNRRLIREQPTSTVTTATAIVAGAGVALASPATTITTTAGVGAAPSETAGAHSFVIPFEQQELLLSESIIEDSKSSIIKVEINTDLQQHQQQQQENKDVKLLEFPLQIGVPTITSTTFTGLPKIIRKNNCHSSGTLKFISQRSSQYALLNAYNLAILQEDKKPNADEKPIDANLFNCFTCKQSFSRVNLYDQHLLDHPAECFTCGKKFSRWKNFSLHLKRHMGWKKFACTVCNKKFVVRSALVEHQRIHNGQLPLKCLLCGRHFRRYSNLTQHRKLHHNNKSTIIRKKEYVCFCGEVLPSKARFNWHKETHDSKPKCCPHCCDRFIHSNSLRRHIRLAHSDKFDYTEPMECPMCKQVFAKTSIKAHMATHSVDTQQVCLICNKTFSTKWNLKIHNWVHANRTSKPFKCEYCVKAFVREVDFKNHMNAHKQIKPYTCEYCGCKFIRKYNYIRHRREHHGKKKFTCDLCKKSFHRHYYLIEHRRIHTGERPFQCTICGKSSTTKTNHNKHLKIHNSRDPFTVEA